MQNVVKRINVYVLLMIIFMCIGCDNGKTGFGYSTVYDVTADKQIVSVGDEITVGFYATTGAFDNWKDFKVDNETHKLVYKDSTSDYITSFVYFIDGIDENDMEQKTWNGHVQYIIPYPYGNSEYTEKDVTKITEYTYYHFDEETRIIKLKFNVPEGLKSGYLKIHYQADYAAGFYPNKITVLEN